MQSAQAVEETNCQQASKIIDMSESPALKAVLRNQFSVDFPFDFHLPLLSLGHATAIEEAHNCL